MAAPDRSTNHVTLELLALQLDHLQETMDGLSRQFAEMEKRLRSVEDDRLRAWTVVGVVSLFGMTGVAAFLKWILTT